MAKKDFYAQGSRHQFKERGEDLTISHVPTGEMVAFPAFLDLFSDNFSSQWNSEDVYGRMDPITTFVNTRRSLSVAWWVPADSFEHAEENLAKANKLIGFLYPLYDSRGNGGATVINQGPLMRVSFGNLIRNSTTGSGLLGYVNGFTFDPALEYGMFNRRAMVKSETPNHNPQWNEYYPKTFRMNFEFNVLHEHSLGFKNPDKRGGNYNGKGVNGANYPYTSDRTAEGDLVSKGQRIKNRGPAGSKDPNTPRRAGTFNLFNSSGED